MKDTNYSITTSMQNINGGAWSYVLYISAKNTSSLNYWGESSTNANFDIKGF